MIKKCVVCGLEPFNGEHYVIIQAFIGHTDGPDSAGLCCLVCKKHIPEEIVNKLFGSPSFMLSNQQAMMEQTWFRRRP